MTDQTVGKENTTPYTIQVTEPESWKRAIKVSVDQGFFDEEYAKNLLKARKKHARPGFRKGKVPMAMVEKDLGGEVRMETLDEIIPKAYQTAMVEHKLYPVSDPVLDDLKFEEGSPIVLDLSVEIRPEIEATGYNDLSLTERKAELADGAVDEILERLRDSRATWDKVDRPAAKDDKAKIDITPMGEDGKPDTTKTVPDYGFDIGAEGNFDEFNEALTGAVVGDERDITVVYPDDYFTEELKGKTVAYHVTVKEIEEKTLPELDDAFASGLKDGQTLLELRAKTREELQAEETRKMEQQTNDEIIDLLIEKNPVDLPPTLVNQYLDSGVQEFKSRSEGMGRPVSDEDIAQYREGGREAAQRSIKAMLIMESIRRQEKNRDRQGRNQQPYR
jgi:trigger factor